MMDVWDRKRDWRADLVPYLPPKAAALLGGVPDGAPLEEIRIRAEQPVQLCFAGGDRLLYGAGGRAPVTADDCAAMLRRFCDQSLYAWEAELRQCFLTLPGGYRVGLCGRMETENGRPSAICEAAAFNIRIAREVRGAAAALMPRLVDACGRIRPTLLVSAPGAGKTTMLRDIARSASYGLYGARACRVAVADTRYELAGSVRGVPQNDLGPRTDVLSGVGRADACRMLVKNMSPDLLVTDELTTAADAEAVYEAACSGVSVVASAHAYSGDDLLRRRALLPLMQAQIFRRIVLLGRSRGAGTVEGVTDGLLRTLERRETLCCAHSRR